MVVVKKIPRDVFVHSPMTPTQPVELGRMRSPNALLTKMLQSTRQKLNNYNRYTPVFQLDRTMAQLNQKLSLNDLQKVCDDELVSVPPIAFSTKVVSGDPQPKLLLAFFSHRQLNDNVRAVSFHVNALHYSQTVIAGGQISTPPTSNL